jgi:hypothetical protein
LRHSDTARGRTIKPAALAAHVHLLRNLRDLIRDLRSFFAEREGCDSSVAAAMSDQDGHRGEM